MNTTQHNTKRTLRYRNKITNTKIITESDDESEHDDNNYKIKLNNDIDSDLESETYNLDNLDNSNDKQNKNNLLNIKFENYKSDLISKFIVQDKITDFNSKSILCYYLWSGIEDLDRWELNRKINLEHVKKIYKEMAKDYERIGEFIFYEPVHLAIKSDSIFYIIDGQHRLLACANYL